MDALTHAIEAVVSRSGTPISEGLALQAIRMVHEQLPKCIERPGDLEARVQMQLASTMAGWAFNVAGVHHAGVELPAAPDSGPSRLTEAAM